MKNAVSYNPKPLDPKSFSSDEKLRIDNLTTIVKPELEKLFDGYIIFEFIPTRRLKENNRVLFTMTIQMVFENHIFGPRIQILAEYMPMVRVSYDIIDSVTQNSSHSDPFVKALNFILKFVTYKSRTIIYNWAIRQGWFDKTNLNLRDLKCVCFDRTREQNDYKNKNCLEPILNCHLSSPLYKFEENESKENIIKLSKEKALKNPIYSIPNFKSVAFTSKNTFEVKFGLDEEQLKEVNKFIEYCKDNNKDHYIYPQYKGGPYAESVTYFNLVETCELEIDKRKIYEKTIGGLLYE